MVTATQSSAAGLPLPDTVAVVKFEVLWPSQGQFSAGDGARIAADTAHDAASAPPTSGKGPRLEERQPWLPITTRSRLSILLRHEQALNLSERGINLRQLGIDRSAFEPQRVVDGGVA